MRLGGCVHRLDFLRNVLLEGLREQRRIGVNPYRLGMIGSTDTHNGTPGHTATIGFPGHIGLSDAAPDERLGWGNVTHDGIINNPGGLVAVWAEQNTREDIFDALRRREVYATSGSRIVLRLFAGSGYPADLCDHADPIAEADAGGVAMGEVLSAGDSTATPTLFVQAEHDPGSASRPGVLLQRIQIVKGWLDAADETHVAIYDVAGDADNGASVSTSCELSGPGAESLCAVWTDPDYAADELAFYYARVLENPSCRWSAHECNALGADAPEACSDPSVPRVVQQRAWSSPIWVGP
jgi:hypothetical protein